MWKILGCRAGAMLLDQPLTRATQLQAGAVDQQVQRPAARVVPDDGAQAEQQHVAGEQRGEENVAAGNRNATIQRLTAGAKADGTLVALGGEFVNAIGFGGWSSSTEGPMKMLYACDNVRTTQYPAKLNLPPMAAFRAPGFVEGTFALECLLDEVAAKLGNILELQPPEGEGAEQGGDGAANHPRPHAFGRGSAAARVATGFMGRRFRALSLRARASTCRTRHRRRGRT